MKNILCHIVGLDEIHKKKLIKYFSGSVRFVDMDDIQQIVYNDPSIVKKKLKWDKLSKDILINKNQKKLSGSVKANFFDKKISELVKKRNNVKFQIHQLWKEMIMNQFNNELKSVDTDEKIIVLGFNIFPKDYRVKVNLPINNIKIGKLSNHLLYNVRATHYAENQIKYYLKMYQNKIIKGQFPLNLLKNEYLVSKYDKFTNYYDKQGYTFINDDELYKHIEDLIDHFDESKQLSNQIVYVATIFKSGDTIPFNAKSPVEGFLSRDDAITNIKTKMQKNVPVYVYEISPDQFKWVDNKLIALKQLNPMKESSIILS